MRLASGRSVCSRFERRMAPQSKELFGLVLPYQVRGEHLDNHGKTVDKSREVENFEFAGKILAEVRLSVALDR